mgnify:CR=1 FL=1
MTAWLTDLNGEHTDDVSEDAVQALLASLDPGNVEAESARPSSSGNSLPGRNDLPWPTPSMARW